MRKILLVLMLVALVSCDEHQGTLAGTNETNQIGFTENHRVVVIDSCEYIIYDIHQPYVGYGYMAHKGNCKYCAEREK